MKESTKLVLFSALWLLHGMWEAIILPISKLISIRWVFSIKKMWSQRRARFDLRDIIIIALQEIVKLNASQVLSGKDPKRIALWE